MKKEGIASIGTIAVFACLLLCTPALAYYDFDGFPVVTRTNGTAYGGVFIDGVSWTGATTLTGHFNVPDGDIKWARLYTGVWGGNPYNTGWVNVTFNEIYDRNGLGPLHLQGEDDTNPNVWCSGCGKYWMWYNVTNLTNAGQINTAKTRRINGSLDGRIYGIVLVVVYRGGNNPKDIQYWINDGSDALHYFSWVCPECGEKNENTTYFNGTVNKDIVTKANLTMVHLTGYEPGCDSCLKFNDNSLDTSMVDSNTFELNSWDVTSYVNSSENNAWYTRCEDWPSCTDEKSDYFVNIANTILVLEREAVGKPDLMITAINAYHYNPAGSRVWFDLSNEVDVTVKNNGTAGAGAFNVGLYADGDLIGKKTVSGLGVGEKTTVQFKWAPIGEDCFEDCTFTDTSRSYELKAIADCDSDVIESDETNNERIVEERVCYNGYMADEPLENVAHGKLHGTLLFTTGDGEYGGLYSVGSSIDTTYEITLPEGASVELARLNVYYTWQYATSCPEMEVSITYDGNTYVLPVDKRYNDIKCWEPWNFPWGNYVFNLTDHIQGSGTYTYTVTVKRTGGPSFCIAAPCIEVLYQDETKPLMEYWINEGADVLTGGRRCEGGHLSLAECINNAMFPASSETRTVTNATLGVVAPWGGCAWVPGTTNYLYFNGIELGRGVYHGYDETYSETIDGMTMHIGSTNAQVGVNVTDVTSYYLKASDNVVGQGDDGDCMMPANAFLVVSYGEEFFDTGSSANPYPSIFGTHNGTITVYQNITVNSMYTYPCSGTGGHTEFVKIWNETTGDCAEAHWDDYIGDYHNISFDGTLILKKGVIYNYTIRTGSYPQIHHRDELEVASGIIRCTKFTDANGKVYYNWIPAIKLY